MKTGKLLLLAAICCVGTAAYADGVPASVPTGDLEPGLFFRQFGDGNDSLLNQNLPSDTWQNETNPRKVANDEASYQVTYHLSGSAVMPRADARQSGDFDRSSTVIKGSKVAEYQFKERVVGSPLPVGDRLVVTTEGGVAAVAPRAGKALWSVKLDGTPSGISALGDTIFVPTDTGTLYAIDSRSGTLIWKNVGERFFKAAPLVDGSTLYLGDMERGLTAYNVGNGSEKWTYPLEGGMSSEPLLYNGQLLVGGHNTRFFALNPETGAKLWSGGANGALYQNPSADGGVIYFAGDDGTVVATQQKKVIPLWRSDDLGSPASSPLPDKRGFVFMVNHDGLIFALDAKTGLVRQKNDLGEPVSGKPVLGANQLFVCSSNGKLHALPLINNLNSWTLDLGASSEGSMILWNNTLWVPNGNKVTAIQ